MHLSYKASCVEHWVIFINLIESKNGVGFKMDLEFYSL